MSQSGGELKNLWQILKPHRPSKMQFTVLSVLVVVTTVLELLIPWFSKNLVDSISVDGVAMSVLMTLLSIVLISAVFEGILTWYGAKTGERICTSLRYSLIGKLLFSKVEAASDKHSAEYATRVVNDTLEVKTVLATDFISLFAGAVSLVAVVAMMFYLDWRLTLVLLACVLVGFFNYFAFISDDEWYW
ncbi:ABC transporter transmembrane domain-containing protein [Pseudoalteromonas phenolica]|uniref:ABC transporter transmembrane domain-containing protein n=1 Tax=Pseudoalteromonas phenolica TaxID=161398 RepID=UPI000FFE56A7|nr:ABC transporter transmembrane domain-containing protein [Pseudoalteromonas phenolica]RXE93303.1 ABC transporter ATP-binding protein [Pseudoalteromonas phenolica O-BC30]